jgi:Cu(I)/Ag(I) efflux system membrane fusion protein
MSDSEQAVANQSSDSAMRKSGSRGSRRIVYIVIILLVGLAAFLLGYFVAPGHRAVSVDETKVLVTDKRIRYWTCSMHPQIHMPQKGKCPICFMDLVPVYESVSGGETGGERLVLSKRARELAEIETSPVGYRPLSVIVRMVGKIDYDEMRLAYVSAWVPGRIDKLFVNYVGMRVKKGDHVVSLYSPDLRTAQEEYLIAFKRWQTARQSGDTDAVTSAQSVKDASRKKLELWGILATQIEELEKSGKTDDHTTIYAPIGGTIIGKEAFEGKYVQSGEHLFTIADLGTVWAMLDAYEIDLGWLRYGQTVEFENDAYPGEVFKGHIAFIQPFVNEMTRTVKVRVNIPNPGERLKPGMFVRAKLDVTLAENGQVKEPDLAGKWICPMHPEIVKDSAGTCDICGMDLVEAEKLGFAKTEMPAKRVLSIPATAPLLTGTRAVVYVEEQSGEETSYIGRQVELGPRAGDYYVVISGLSEGERVVTRGNFKIDAALQIQAKPSMMNPEGGAAPVHQHGGSTPQNPANPPVTQAQPTEKSSYLDEIQPVIDSYLALAESLASDDVTKSGEVITALRERLNTVQEKISGHALHLTGLMRDVIPVETPKEIGLQREVLGKLSKLVVEYLRSFGHKSGVSIFEIFCPMAFGGKGATWIQKGNDVRNPYFGHEMPGCGEVRQEFKPQKGDNR